MRQTSTLYDVLGVGIEATEQEIRAAFRQLTMENHPDRFIDTKQREVAEQTFQRITEAFNVLSRPEARAKYDKEVSVGGSGKTMDRKEIGRRLAARGAQAYRNGQIVDAIEALEQAVDHDDANSRAHYFLGVALAAAKGREKEALRHLERATQLEPENSAMKAEAAALFLAAGMRARAVRLAEDALAIDPTSSKATDVLNEVKEQEEGPEPEGLLGRFRRKG
ncbi:MAG: J domain-containing protein [bacterium]|nr:J domain-containing protein [bacterium]